MTEYYSVVQAAVSFSGVLGGRRVKGGEDGRRLARKTFVIAGAPNRQTKERESLDFRKSESKAPKLLPYKLAGGTPCSASRVISSHLASAFSHLTL